MEMHHLGSFIWDRIVERRFDRDGLLAAVLDEFDVEPGVAAADLDALLAEMRARDLIVGS